MEAAVSDLVTTTDRIAEIQAFQRELAKCPQIDIPTMHDFAPGQYARTVFLPAGTVAIGRIHKHDHLLIIASGDLLIETEHGMERVTGFRVLRSPAGIKRAVQVFADTILTTVHLNPTNETDIATLEDAMTEWEPSPFEALEVQP